MMVAFSGRFLVYPSLPFAVGWDTCFLFFGHAVARVYPVGLYGCGFRMEFLACRLVHIDFPWFGWTWLIGVLWVFGGRSEAAT